MLLIKYSAVRKTADPALKDEFKVRISKSLSKKERELLSSQSYEKLEELMRYYLGQAQSEQEKYRADNKWINRAGRRTTEFLNNFNGYVEAYSGIIQIMNGAGPFGQGYGDAAYGALSLFLVV
jgi:predicted RNA-binding protein